MGTILDDFKLNGKVVLVTGGSDGIGKELALALGQAGAHICINGREPKKLEAAKEQLKSSGIEVTTACFDVSDVEQVKLGVKGLIDKIGNIDILINSAGIIKRIPLLEMDIEDFRQVLDVNLSAAFLVSKTVVPSMIQRGGGKIINICSLMSEYGRHSVSAYAASKGGLKMLTKNMCVEWAKHNIQVNGIGPGYIKTAKTKTLAADGHPFNDLIMTRTPAKRWGEVKDLCGLGVLLASKAGSFINGQIIYVDGGITSNFGYIKGE
ncbi:SDR family NAD(P)-dependent oxidoreductase [Seonamhaeicola sp.]|uniref:SDR family NAD(P)-dependent oxidoreductase n=1 Tax=Seonamhaeicola sp. TaxID=1912245 RepID=UPI002606564A|nr:SDR family NAD(P)-dependent oxidoreductase [Seonamhaeicola sp.]